MQIKNDDNFNYACRHIIGFEKYEVNEDYVQKITDYIKTSLEKINTDINKDIENINKETSEDDINKIEQDINNIEDRIRSFSGNYMTFFYNYIKDKNTYQKKYFQDQANIYHTHCCVRSKVLAIWKAKFVRKQERTFKKMSGKEKFWRVFLLVIAFPIYAPIFILVKAIRKFIYCLTVGLEVVGLILYRLTSGEWKDCKDKWAEACEEGYLDGIKINGEEVCKRIRWYETSRCLFWRRVFFPINLAIFIVIGVVLAAFKFIKSIFKIFVMVYRVRKDILSDDPCAYMFKKEGIMFYNDSKILYNSSLTAIVADNKKKIKVKDKFVDMTCPRIPCYDFAEKPKSAWEHFKCLTGFKNIKDAELWDQYEHWQRNRAD